LWQSLEWKKYQESLGRETKIYVVEEGNEITTSALVIIDRTTFGLTSWEIPRGPIGKDIRELIDNVISEAKKEKCFALFLSPPVPLPLEAKSYKLKASKRFQQPEATRIIHLEKAEQEILNQMKQKGRYNIRIAERHEVTVKESDDIDSFYELIMETTKRDKFKGHSKDHYQKFLESLEGSFLLLARIPQEKKPIAGLLGVIWDQTGTYYYGSSSSAHRAVMASYALQWEAICLSKAHGCTSYDLFGIAPADAPDSHPWKGVSAFKEKFGGEVVQYSEEQVVVLKPLVKMLLTLKRKFF